MTITKKISILLIYLCLCSCGDKQNVEHLIFKDEIGFKPDSEQPYTGKVFKLGKSGSIQFEGNYKDGKRNGEFVFYDENKKIKKTENFSEGKKQGKFVTYNSNGSVAEVSEYNLGNENGLQTIYTNGKKIFEGAFENGHPKGIHKYYFTNSTQEMATFSHKNGSIEIASAKLFYQNGKIKTEFKRTAFNNYRMLEYSEKGILKHQVEICYEFYEEKINHSIFHFIEVVGGTSKFDLGDGVYKKAGTEIYYNEDGTISKRIKYFFPNLGSMKKTYYSGVISNYNDITSFTEIFDKQGNVITKCADGTNGNYGCVTGNEINNMELTSN